MRLEPGAMRELHWHATAAEWAFVDKGRVRTTVIGPGGYAETNDFEPGDVWYFPRGHGHMLECLGDEPCHFVLIFDNGYFSEFGTFSITDWIGHTPKPLLAKNFGLPANRPSTGSRRRRCTSPAERCRPRSRPPRSGRAKPPPQTHKYRLLGATARRQQQGRPAVAGRFPQVPDLQDDHRRDPRARPGGAAGTALAPDGRRVAVRPRREGQRDDVRLGRPLPDRDAGDRATSATSRKGYGHSIENVGDKPCRVLIGFNSGIYEEIDLSEWIAGNPPDVLATNFGKPAALFEKFPHKDVFIAPDGGSNK